MACCRNSSNKGTRKLQCLDAQQRQAAVVAGNIGGRVVPGAEDAGNEERIALHQMGQLEAVAGKQFGILAGRHLKRTAAQVPQRDQAVGIPADRQHRTRFKVAAIDRQVRQEIRSKGLGFFETVAESAEVAVPDETAENIERILARRRPARNITPQPFERRSAQQLTRLMLNEHRQRFKVSRCRHPPPIELLHLGEEVVQFGYRLFLLVHLGAKLGKRRYFNSANVKHSMYSLSI